MEATSETLLLLSNEGICLDVCAHTDLWFLQPDVILGKNVLALLPSHTYHKLIVDFQRVLINKISVTHCFRLPLKDETYFGECKFIPFDGNVLCRYTDITNRENISQKLTQTYEEMQEIQHVAQIGKWALNTETNELFYTGSYADNDEVRSLSLPLERFMRLVIPEDRVKMTSWLERILKHTSNQNISFRVRILRHIYYMSVKCITRRKKPHGTDNIIEGIIQNVTEMHKRRNDINMLTHVIFNANESIYGALPDGTMKFANQVFRHHHHIDIDADISQYKVYNTNYVYAQSKAEWNERVNAMEGKVDVNFLYDNQALDDSAEPIVYEGKFYKMTEDDGTFSYWAFAHDVTQRVRFESEMKRYNQLLSTIFNNIPASISVKDVDDDYRFIYRNSLVDDKRIALTDITSKVKLTDFDVFPDDEAWKIRREDSLINETGETIHQVVQGVNQNGEVLYYDILKLKISDPNFSPMILCIKWNVTPLELMKRKLVDAKQKAEESDRLKTIFLANISHEIRTPLNVIVGFSNIMVDCDSQEQRESYHSIIDQSTKRLLKFINQILLLSRLESGEIKLSLTDIRLNDLCNEVYDFADSESTEKVNVIFESPKDNLVINTDSNYLIQVFMILIRTAFKFIDKGSVWFGYVNKDSCVEFYVRDNGKGLVSGNEDVFSLFTRYNYGNDGSELELTICHALVQMLGGTISAESKKDMGSRFVFTLPKHMNNLDSD